MIRGTFYIVARADDMDFMLLIYQLALMSNDDLFGRDDGRTPHILTFCFMILRIIPTEEEIMERGPMKLKLFVGEHQQLVG